ncbi:hypothetical protein MJG53_010007 [Ovis ammon polii x Ovis aries]|uniref:Uncharacterized protein n=1 Tax=Ovis ammon polii x Ovis aries TaxID=2918886 RepID=A0ACB9UVL7_9CETA|nr:hypothetical protein MJG53_010007 [Ovis ammon polii x Ovis aries]
MLPVSAEVKTSPLQKANFFSRLFVWWLNPLFKIGHKRKLEPDDMYSVLPEDHSQHLGEELQGYWDQEVKRAQKDAREPSLVKAIIECYWKSYLIWGMFTFLEEGTRVVQPIFLGKMISYVENYHLSDSATLHEAYGCAAGLSACVLVWAVLHHLYFYHIQRLGMRLRVAVCHMIYRKALRLSSSAMGKTTTGQVVNLLSNDVNRFDQNIVAVGQICVVVDTSLSSINSSNMNKEISKILKSSYLRGMNLASFFTVSKIMIFVTFITNELLDNWITASQVFVVVTLFEALWFSSTLYFPMAIEKVSEAVVSIQRIKNFLLLDEITQCYPLLPSDGKTIVDVQAFTASWEKASETPTLQGLSFTVRPGEVLAVVGPVGAGKSSLLSALLGELPPSQGKVSVHGRIAYVSQQPWVFPGTIKSNILFGKKYEEDRYEEVIRACALEETENIQVVLPLEGHLEGKVDFKTYKNYFTAGAHWPVIIFLILANIAAQVAYVLQDWWLAYWANVQSDLYFVGYLKEDEDVVFVLNWCLGVYSGLTVSTVLFGITRSLLIFYILVNSSRALHNKMLESVLRAPVLFFHRNPVGRILNRFSKDVGHMDDLLPLIFLDFIQTFLLMVGVVGVMVAAVPWTAIPVIPLGIISFFLRRYFLETSRDVKRLECTNVICAIFVTVVAFGALILVESLDVGHVGLVLSLSITLTRMSQWCVRQSVEVENMMISVERVIEYTDLVKEASWELEYRPLPSWPKKGLIFFDNVNFSHMLDGPRVLRNMDTGFYPGQKIGIVGRSGAGKSSLTAALFRLSEPEGSIYIDHILTTRIGLHDLRKKMSVALQEPVLFTGTMRENLDPYHEHTDNELWNALEEVQLKESIESLPAKMNTELAESGLNLSVGQKQLVCLARALLRKNQILILDKATSYVDPRTDEFIQKKICERFAQCTVLTISHRLSTIIDSEFMMVLDSGTEKERNWPSILLQHRNCLFYQMLQQLGKKEAARLTKKAKRRTSKGDSQILQ